MDKSTLSNYGWIVIVTLVLAVMLALATPFGTFVGKGASNVIKTFVQSSDNAVDEDNIDTQSEQWEEYLQTGTKYENNHSQYVKDSDIETGLSTDITTEKSDNYIMAFYEKDTNFTRVHNFIYWDIRDPETNAYPETEKYPIWKAVFEDCYDTSFNIMQIPFDSNDLPVIEIDSNTAIDISAAQDKSVIAYVTSEDNALLFHIAGEDGVVMASEDTSGLFIGCGMHEVDFNNNFNTSELVTAVSMFDSNFFTELNLSSLDLSNLENAESMFAANWELKKLKLPTMTSGSLKRMDYMFYGCKKIEYMDLINFNTENVTSFNHCFTSCENLKAIDVSNFNTKSATTFQRMFAWCPLLKNIYINENIFIIDSSDVTTEMFKDSGTDQLINIA